jgi:hypothetical protein
MTSLQSAKELWKAWALPKCKFFFWLLLHDRRWTAARRKRRGLQDEDVCALCDQEQETAQHLAGECVFAREVWYRVLAPIGLELLTPQPRTSFLDWWLSRRILLGTTRRKGFNSLAILGSWCLWKERNRRVFDGVGRLVVAVADSIVEEAVRWSQAGNSHLAAL